MAATPIDPSVSHQIYVERVSTEQANTILPILKQLTTAIRKVIANFDETNLDTVAQGNELIKLIKAEYEKFLLPFNQNTIDFLNEFIAYERGFETRLLNEYTIKSYDVKEPDLDNLVKFVLASPMMIEKHNAPITVNKSLDQLLIVANRNMSEIIKSASRQGISISAVKSALLGTASNNYADGEINRIYKHSKMLTHDSVTHSSEMVKFKVGSDNKAAVTGYRVTATFDGRTSQICRDRDGDFISIDDKHAKNKFPPYHRNCRTIVRPVLRDDLQALRKADKKAVGSNTKRIGSNVQYYDWLKTQSAEFQDDVLGKARGYAFRNSGLSAQEFKKATVNRMGEPLPLYKMEAKDKKILDSVKKYKKDEADE